MKRALAAVCLVGLIRVVDQRVRGALQLRLTERLSVCDARAGDHDRPTERERGSDDVSFPVGVLAGPPSHRLQEYAADVYLSTDQVPTWLLW